MFLIPSFLTEPSSPPTFKVECFDSTCRVVRIADGSEVKRFSGRGAQLRAVVWVLVHGP